MQIKLKGFDQVTAWIGGIALSAIVFTGIWYTAKNIGKNMDATDAARVEKAEKDLETFAKQNQHEVAPRADNANEKAREKSTDHLTPGKSGDTLESWGYTGNLAPWYWANLNEKWAACGKKQNQSPIDISGSRLDERLKALKLFYFHGTTNFTMHHDTVQGDIQRGSYLDWDGERFDLTRVFFRTPSEHRVNSLPWEMEVQLEHRAATGQLIMLSVLVTPGKESPVIDRIGNNMPRYKDDIKDMDRLQWLELLPQKKTYWKYTGTSTTPPCEANVTWIVMTEPVTTLKKTIDKFVLLQKSNVRPVYSLGTRALGRSNR